MLVDPAYLKPGLTRHDVMAALQAEGVNANDMWGHVMYRQNLWSVAPDQFRIESCETAEKLVYNQTMHMALQYLMLSEKETGMVADAFEKVMNAYRA